MVGSRLEQAANDEREADTTPTIQTNWSCCYAFERQTTRMSGITIARSRACGSIRDKSGSGPALNCWPLSMKHQPNRNYRSNDVVMTPRWLAEMLVQSLQPSGHILEPCAGQGAFAEALRPYGQVSALDVTAGHPGFEWWTERVDWVVTNPPWSQFRTFLVHGMEVADHVALLSTVNHWWTKRRVTEVRRHGFGYRKLLLCPWPQEFPASGFQLGMMLIERGYKGDMAIEELMRPKAIAS
jgi:hypothetical protein